MKRIALALIVLLAGLELIYLVAANGFLNTRFFSKVVNRDPYKLSVEYESAWTLVPGWVQLTGFRIGGQDKAVRWRVDLARAKVRVNLPQLFVRRFQALRVEADGGKFNLVTGLPVREDRPDAGTRGRDPFKVDIAGIDIKNFDAIEFDGYHYQGPGRIEGSFFLWPGRRLHVRESVVTLSGGHVSYVGKRITSDLHGSIRGKIKNWLPKEERGGAIFNKLDSEIRLTGKLNDVDFLSTYLKGIPWLRILAVSGDFEISGDILDGKLKPGSTTSVTAHSMQAALANYRARGSGNLHWDVTEQGIDLTLGLSNYMATSPGQKTPFMRGDHLSLRAQTQSSHVRRIFSDFSKLTATLSLPKAIVSDMRFVNAFMPTKDVEVQSGTAVLEAMLNVSTHEKGKPGFVRVRTEDLGVRFQQHQLRGKVALDARIRDIAKGAGAFEISGTELSLRGASVTDHQPWSGRVAIEKGWLKPRRAESLIGRATVNFSDVRPLLSVLSESLFIARLLEKTVDMKEVRGFSNFTIGPGQMRFENVTIDSSDLDIAGHVGFFKDSRHIMALAQIGILTIGIDMNPEGTETKIIGAQSWIENRPGWREGLRPPVAPPKLPGLRIMR